MGRKGYWLSAIIAVAIGFCCALEGASFAATLRGIKNSTAVAITSPSSGVMVSGSIAIVDKISSSVSWVNFYIDGGWIASSPPYSITWNTNTVPNGPHVVSVKGYSSSKVLLGTSAINLTVNNTPSPSPTPSATPTSTPVSTPTATPASTPTPTSTPVSTPTLTPISTPTPTSSPTATATPTPVQTPAPTGTSYYLDSNQVGYNGASAPSAGSACALADAGPGTSSASPKCTLASLSAIQASLTSDNQVLFKRGDIWNEELSITSLQGTLGHPVILGAYGSGALPVIDGGSKRATCISAFGTTAKYLTIDSFECRNTTQEAIAFQTSGGKMPGITVQNSYIHNTGPGAYAGGSGAFDDGGYRNQLDFEDYGAGTGLDGVKFLHNTILNCGGHNCLQVHYDGGSPVVQGNKVGPGCVHNCIDLKGTNGALIDQNTATTGVKTTPQGCIYLENTYSASSSVTVTRNVCHDSGVGFQVDTGGTCIGHTHCLQTIQAYNNTLVAPTNTAFPIIVGGTNASDITITWENNITDGGTIDINSGVNWYGDYNDDGGHQGQYSTSVTYGSHDMLNADPMYVNFGGNNFQLQPGSPVANTGLPGLDNGMVSMGAY